MRLYRQGDVLLVAVKSIPRRARKQRRSGRLVLAEGEVTGHAHAILDREAELFLLADVEELERTFLRVEAEVALVHQEHATVMLPPGKYEVRRQREYSPEAIRRVSD